jgi:hypothetical protein
LGSLARQALLTAWATLSALFSHELLFFLRLALNCDPPDFYLLSS